MSTPQSSSRPSLILVAAALIGGSAFLYMVKLMHDMTLAVGQMAGEMSAMSANMAKMQTDMASLARDVGDMREKVGALPGMAADMQQMRASMARVTGLFGGCGEPLRQVNPVEIMQQMMPGTERR